MSGIISLVWSSCRLVSRLCLNLAAIAVLLVVPAGSSSLLPIDTSSALGPIPLTFSPHTGRINNNLLAEGLLIAINLGLVITKTVMDTSFISPRSNMKYPFLVLIAFLFFTHSFLHSQEGWRRLTTADGLSSHVINTIYQAKNGDIWIGTDEEINRYNGVFEESWALFFPVNTIFAPSTGQLFSREDRPDGPLGSGGFESPFFWWFRMERHRYIGCGIKNAWIFCWVNW